MQALERIAKLESQLAAVTAERDALKEAFNNPVQKSEWQRLVAERDEHKKALETIASMKDDWGMLYANQVIPIVRKALAAVEEK